MARNFTETQKKQFAEAKEKKLEGLRRLDEKRKSMSERELDQLCGHIVSRFGGLRNPITGHVYSPRNTVLAVMQSEKPIMGLVAGFEQWRQLGYKVISGKGSGLTILFPRMGSEKDEAGNKVEGGAVYFAGCGTATVFDFTQVAPMNEKAVTLLQLEANLGKDNVALLAMGDSDNG